MLDVAHISHTQKAKIQRTQPGKLHPLKHPKLNARSGSSEPSATGASLAAKARVLIGKTKVVADLKAGAIQAMVVQDPFQMGFQTVKTLVDKLDGKAPPKRIDLSAKVIFAEDVDKPENQRLLSQELK